MYKRAAHYQPHKQYGAAYHPGVPGEISGAEGKITMELWNVATSTGLFYLKDSGISEDEIQRIFDNKAFFYLPADVKARYAFSLKRNVGWESGQQKRASHNPPELKELLQLKWHDMDGKWPTDEDIQGF